MNSNPPHSAKLAVLPAALLVLAITLAGGTGWRMWKQRDATGISAPGPTDLAPETSPSSPTTTANRPADVPADAPAQAPAESERPPSAAVAAASGPEVARVFRLVVEAGRCSLEAVEDVRGDFRRERRAAWAPGMLCCRLLDANNQVLAEEVVRAPDAVCVVLDANSAPDGKPEAVEFTPIGPVLFQVRMPPRDDAVLMKIYRLESSTRAGWTAEPAGALLAAIPLPHK